MTSDLPSITGITQSEYSQADDAPATRPSLATRSRNLFSRAYSNARAANRGIWNRVALACGIAAIACALYPTNHARDYAVSPDGKKSGFVRFIDGYGRHVNTVALVAMPLLMRDPVGAAQLLQAGVLSTLVTQGGKRVLNNTVVGGTRLGQRPLKPDSRNNSPSGHSALASTGAFFVARRYGWYWLLLLVPIMLLTMWARVELDAHTVSAVLAGMLIGLALCLWLVSPRRNDAGQGGAA